GAPPARAPVTRRPTDHGPPPITYRPDGVTLFGHCDHDADCTPIAQRQLDGSIRLAYHGTINHSMVLDRAQQRALADVLPALNPAWTYEGYHHETSLAAA